MLSQHIRRLVLALVHIFSHFRHNNAWRSSALNLIKLSFRPGPSCWLFTGDKSQPTPKNVSTPSVSGKNSEHEAAETTILCSLFHKPRVVTSVPSIPTGEGTHSPVRSAAPGLSDSTGTTEYIPRGRPTFSISPSRGTRQTTSISPSSTRASALLPDPLLSPNSHGSPPSFSHSRSPSRTGTFHHPTRTPTLVHRRETSASQAVISLTTSTRFQPSWLKAPESLKIVEPPPLPRNLSDPSTIPVHPEGLARGVRRILISKTETEIEISPMTRSFEPVWRPEGWAPVLHPEGVTYFFHGEKRIFTDAYIYDRDIYHHLQSHLAVVETFLSDIGRNSLIGHCDLVMDLVPRNPDGYDVKHGTYTGDYDCGYYFVDHDKRTVFWLDNFPGSYFQTGVRGVNCKTHLRHEIEAQYWYHCQLFPSSIELNQPIIQELRDVILHNLGDTLTRPYSTSPFGQEDLNKILNWSNSLSNSSSENLDALGPSLGAASLLGRLMFCFTRERFCHFYGQPAVRLARDLSVHGDAGQRTLLIRILSPLLLSAPIHNLKTLEKIWVDQIMHVPAWKAASRRLTNQWRDFILYATVTLNANVAFLSIQSIDDIQPPFRHPTQIASYLSIIFSIGSIVTGLLLLKTNRTEFNVQYLYCKHHSISAVETLAILHSLPYAFLIWAMISFLFSFCCMCFIGTTAVTRILVGGAFAVTGILFVWCAQRVSGMETQQQFKTDQGPIRNIPDKA